MDGSYRAPLSALFILALAACAGSANPTSAGGALPSSPEQAAAARAGSDAKLRIVIHVPRRHHALGARYISPSTKSIVISKQETAPVKGTTTLLFENIVAGNKNCTGTGSNLPFSCTVPIPGVKTGATYSLTFTTYDATQTSASGPYHGHALSQNAASKKIVAGVDNTIGITLAGVPTTFAVSPVSTSAIDGNVSSGLYFLFTNTPKLSIVPLDADGNFILGAGAPAVTASLASGATGGLTLAGPDSLHQYTATATTAGHGTLRISAPVPGSSTPLAVNVSLNAGTYTTLFAGSLESQGSSDGIGTAAQFNAPQDILYDAAAGVLYVADTGNCTIRAMSLSSSNVQTVAGTAGACDETGSDFNGPYAIAESSGGFANFYVTDELGGTIRELFGGGSVSTFASGFGKPQGIVFDPDDSDLYVADYSKCTIDRVTSAGTVTTLVGTATVCNHSGSDLDNPSGVAYAGNQTLFVTDQGNCEVRRIANIDSSPAIDTVASPFAGNSSNCTSVDGTGTAAGFIAPKFIAYDGTGKLYIADGDNSQSTGASLRQIDTTSAAVVTVAGGFSRGYNTGFLSLFVDPRGVAVDAATNEVFVTDTELDVLSEVQL